MAENKFVVFKLANERYGLPIGSVERILPSQPVTRIPKTPAMFLGIFEMRGETLPVIDARTRFGMKEDPGARNFVVVHTKDGRCALRVDEVAGIVTLSESDIDQGNEMLLDSNDDFLSGIGKKNEELTVLLNPDHVVPKNLRSKLVA